jgi:hypothetical protein
MALIRVWLRRLSDVKSLEPGNRNSGEGQLPNQTKSRDQGLEGQPWDPTSKTTMTQTEASKE